MSSDHWRYIVNHVFLPPRLPQSSDYHVDKSLGLLTAVLDSLRTFKDLLPNDERPKWRTMAKMIEDVVELSACDLTEQALVNKIRGMGIGHVLPIHVTTNNAGVIVRRHEGQFSFESFELLPTNKACTSTVGRLVRLFPGPVMGVTQEQIFNGNFVETLADLLVKFDCEAPVDALPKSRKAGSTQAEVRDTTDPSAVTDYMTGILRAVGAPLSTTRIYKHTRDEVIWHNTMEPWHRSPVWLLVRVALQTSLYEQTHDAHARVEYKSFMLFFMSELLQSGLQKSMCSDLLFIMKAKIVKRALKLGDIRECAWWTLVQKTVSDVQAALTDRWRLLESSSDYDATRINQISSLSNYDEDDTKLTLKHLRPFLGKLKRRRNLNSLQKQALPSCASRVWHTSPKRPEKTLSDASSELEQRFHLRDLELWAEFSLDDWLQDMISTEKTCSTIANIFTVYLRKASSIYENCPESISTMILTLLELWIALDRCACIHCPLLLDYDTGLPKNAFDPMLLPTKSHMDRLHSVEEYLSIRKTRANKKLPHMFTTCNEAKSFHVRYYDQSMSLQDRRHTIQEEAKNMRHEKLKELTSLKKQYSDLMSASGALTHEMGTRRKKGKSRVVHEPKCSKCQLKHRAENLSIDVHEWPLPQNDLQAKSVVFELDVPVAVSHWRDITLSMIVDVLSRDHRTSASLEPIYSLHDFSELKKFTSSTPGRLQFQSKIKSFRQSHYHRQKVSVATENSICVKHGLSYSLYDVVPRRECKNFSKHIGIHKSCSSKLPIGEYKNLEFAVNSSTHTSNDVLSRQEECQIPLLQHQFYAFGVLRSGTRLQWRNIARSLVDGYLDFNSYAVYILLNQTAWQLGPLKDVRESHVDLSEENFGKSLVDALNDVLTHFEGNWQSVPAIRIFAMLSHRLLTLSPFVTVKGECFKFLRRVRDVALHWIQHLEAKLDHESDEVARQDLSFRILETALACHSTFCVEKGYLDRVLNSTDDVHQIVKCTTQIREKRPVNSKSFSRSVGLELRRFERWQQYMEAALRERVLSLQTGLDEAVRALWVNFSNAGLWKALARPNERWLVTTMPSKDGCQNDVQYNMLEGDLLVNGLPLSRLPEHYEKHPEFHRLFGKKIIEVIPSGTLGMAFQSRKLIEGYEVGFEMDGQDLIIRLKFLDDVYEIVPLHALQLDFPHALVENYSHWFSLNDHSVEWRHLESLWVPPQRGWRMRIEDGFYRLSKQHERLLDFRRPIAQTLSQLLSPIESAGHIITTLNCDTNETQIKLPRLRLDFVWTKNNSQVVSKQFRKMIVDPHQSIGVFTGLQNKLVLREPRTLARTVIVPHGNVQFSIDGNHVHVSIVNKSSATHIAYQTYCIDGHLGRLVFTDTLLSKLYLTYLLAVTSHCLVDELTGRTGTEQALCILKSGAVLSCSRLQDDEMSLLHSLAALTPRRNYYPSHLRNMQDVKWQNLSMLSQHNSFSNAVEAIFQRAESFDFLYPTSATTPTRNLRNDLPLLKRATIRDSFLYLEGFGAEKYDTTHDIHYQSRDLPSEKEQRVYEFARLVHTWSRSLHSDMILLNEIESWKGVLQGIDENVPFTIGYDAEYLQPAATVFSDRWCTVQALLSKSDINVDKYRVMAFLCTLAFSNRVDLRLVRILLAFATEPDLRTLKAPSYPNFQLSLGYSPLWGELSQIVTEARLSYDSSPEFRMPRENDETDEDYEKRRHDAFRVQSQACVDSFVDALMSQWPVEKPICPSGSQYEAYLCQTAMATLSSRVSSSFQSWYRNWKFKQYADEAQQVLSGLRTSDTVTIGYSLSAPRYSHGLKSVTITCRDMFQHSTPQLPEFESPDFREGLVDIAKSESRSEKLDPLKSRLHCVSAGEFQRRYIFDLEQSVKSLRDELQNHSQSISYDPEKLKPKLVDHLIGAQKHKDAVQTLVHASLRAEKSSTRLLAYTAEMSPRLSANSLLSHISQNNIAELNPGWKLTLSIYGMAISHLQRAERLLLSVDSELHLLDEINNPGRRGWTAADHPDWLLLEIENNMTIRQTQAEIAKVMINPPSSSNSVVQLNMGEGKSSVIVPITAATLSDRTKLARVVVLRPLSVQMSNLLISKLGGMIDKCIYFMPISRSLLMDSMKAAKIRKLFQDCMDTGGILLVHPEHLLSFEMMGAEQIFNGNVEVGQTLTETQTWLNNNSRDIFDESDEILNVNFELVYTMGTQASIELSPERWILITQVLGLVKKFISGILNLFPEGLELFKGQAGGYPRVRILQDDAAKYLVKSLAKAIVYSAGIPDLPLLNISVKDKRFLADFLTNADLHFDQFKTFMAQKRFQSIREKLLLLRGLIAGGVIEFALQHKRWRVNYGLDLSRTMLAIPYRAKDDPALRAEFSHPDATIVMTCLSWYYGGLSLDDLQAAFHTLLSGDNPLEEYELWVKDAPNLPGSFRKLSGVNMSDTFQFSNVMHRHLQFSKSAIDFFLSRIVFPTQMKEFPKKFSTSGWDLAKEKTHPTTGFSGTNDSKYVYPHSIKQWNLAKQQHTNAKVIDYLLQEENAFLALEQGSEKGSMSSLDAESLLMTVVKSSPPVRIIIDVGAQVLELKNQQVAARWLEMTEGSEIRAAVYFDDSNNLVVLNRNGNLAALSSSPFAQQMDQCVVYLDEVHTRGTDLKLPFNSRAVVTLGPGLTKDRLMQACMRMRKLGKGQSVMLCASKEIQQKIRFCCRKTSDSQIEVIDALQWCISETWISTKQAIPRWASQGVHYQPRRKVWLNLAKDGSQGMSRTIASSLLEDEAQTLEHRYGVRDERSDEFFLETSGCERLDQASPEIQAIIKTCRDFDMLTLDGVALQEEQERELSPEKEVQRQVERPPKAEPLIPSVHADVRRFAQTSILARRSPAFEQAFTIFSKTRASHCLRLRDWPPDLLVTRDFTRTVSVRGDEHTEPFLRPVSWMLCSNSTRTDCVIISPHEAQELLPLVRQSKCVTLHMCIPKVNRSMRSMDDLSFCAIPPVAAFWPSENITRQLNIFSGQVYIRNYAEYVELCRFLGLAYQRAAKGSAKIGVDNFVQQQSRSQYDARMHEICRFKKSPVVLLRDIMTLRRYGQSFARSHMGKMLNGGILTNEDFDEHTPAEAVPNTKTTEHNMEDSGDGSFDKDFDVMNIDDDDSKALSDDNDSDVFSEEGEIMEE